MMTNFKPRCKNVIWLALVPMVRSASHLADNELRKKRWNATKFSKEGYQASTYPKTGEFSGEIIQVGKKGKTAFAIRVQKTDKTGRRLFYAAKLPIYEQGGKCPHHLESFENETRRLDTEWKFTENTPGCLKMEGVDRDKCVLMELGQMSMDFSSTKHADYVSDTYNNIVSFLTGLWTAALFQRKLNDTVGWVHNDLVPANVYQNSTKINDKDAYYRYVVADYDFARGQEEKTEKYGHETRTTPNSQIARESIFDLYCSTLNLVCQFAKDEKKAFFQDLWGQMKALKTICHTNGKDDFREITKIIADLLFWVASRKLELACQSEDYDRTALVLDDILRNLVGMTVYDEKTKKIAIDKIDELLCIFQKEFPSNEEMKKSKAVLMNHITAAIPYDIAKHLAKTHEHARETITLKKEVRSSDGLMYEWALWCGMPVLNSMLPQTIVLNQKRGLFRKKRGYNEALRMIMAIMMARYQNGALTVPRDQHNACRDIIDKINGYIGAARIVNKQFAKSKQHPSAKEIIESIEQLCNERLAELCSNDKDLHHNWNKWTFSLLNPTLQEECRQTGSADGAAASTGKGTRRRLLQRLNRLNASMS